MSGRLAEVGLVTALATIVTGLLAMPVLRAPSERVFGAEIVGRHHDPFTVMQQFERLQGSGLYAQPITDLAGALIARVSGGVAAFNLLVLASFPLAAAAAYLLARHLTLSSPAAAIVALAFAFSPFHLAHAAYHPHVAQVQWLPLYFLALWRCLDTATPGAVLALGAATLAVTLSNFYGGLIAAVLTPIAVAAYWVVTRQAGTRPLRRLGITTAALLLMATAGLAYAAFVARSAEMDPAALAFSRADLYRYSAKWWSYLVPPVSHPWLGATARRVWEGAGVQLGLLEQQVTLGWGVITLGLIAIYQWVVRARPPAPLAHVPTLVVVAAAALLCSLSPDRTIGTVHFVRPSAVLYELMPMFRSYARFGVIVQLMAVLLAGIGVDLLLRSGTRARALCAALVAIAAVEYAVLPATLWRDVLPTTAHRWAMQQPAPLRVLDCSPRRAALASVPWLTADRVVLPVARLTDCGEPSLAPKLAALGYTHVLVTTDGTAVPGAGLAMARDGFRLSVDFADSRIYAVTAARPTLYTGIISGFSPREHNPDWSWRWMGAEATWGVINTGNFATAVTLDVELSAFAYDRQLMVTLNGVEVQTLQVGPARLTHRIGPFIVPRGAQELRFRAVEPPTVADRLIHNGDRRPLSIAFGDWAWRVAGDQP